MNIDEIVAASQNKKELKKVLTYVSQIEPKVILTIGQHKQEIANTFAEYFRPHISFIINDNKEKHFADKLTIDFLYIDGKPDYESVKENFKRFSPFVRRGGIIGFNNIMLNDPKYVLQGIQVCKFWAELIAVPGRKYLEFYDHEGGGTGQGLYYI